MRLLNLRGRRIVRLTAAPGVTRKRKRKYGAQCAPLGAPGSAAEQKFDALRAGFFNTEIRHSLEIQREIIYVHHVSSATANYNRLRSFAQPRWSAQRPLPYWLRSL